MIWNVVRQHSSALLRQRSFALLAQRSLSSLPSHTVLSMPALSPTMEQGSIASWSLNEGDAIEPGTVICEIETDKATVDFEAQDEGVLAKILVPAGTSDIKVGTPIGVVVDDKADVKAFENYTAEPAQSSPAPESSPPPPPSPPQPSPPPSSPPTPSPSPKASPSLPVSPSPAVSERTKSAELPEMKSPLRPVFEKAQTQYEDLYGHTLMRRRKEE